jgi:hypothetical protein
MMMREFCGAPGGPSPKGARRIALQGVVSLGVTVPAFSVQAVLSSKVFAGLPS